MADVQHLGHRTHPGVYLCTGQAAQLERMGQVVITVPVGIQGHILKHHGHVPLLGGDGGHGGIVQEDLASIRLFQPGDDAQRGGLAHAGGPQQAEELPIRNLKTHPLERKRAPKSLVKILYPNTRHVSTKGSLSP